ncbi:MAG: NTPase KAP [Candidatus Omnitrophica bacterium]|nr:NTPase KAP [Candidatus Omnitrophota bacterium]MBU4477758.1 NTPase KAP [Candidatus Omnitrophota bacterium]
MWHDIETTTDLLNFTVVAETAAQLIRESNGQPVSVGVSGNWGSGKSSLVKMIGVCLQKDEESRKKYIFVNFNAWLYQGFDDARMALLQVVSDALLDEAEKRKTPLDKALEFAKRVKWFRVGKLVAPVLTGMAVGGTMAGTLGAVIGAVGALANSQGTPSDEDLTKLKNAYAELEPELKGLLKDKEVKSLPKEIAGLRTAFEEVLKDLDITLIVLVDDLDRCLPNTAISTLEAMRLLLFLPRTAFVIAADKQMIRNAVKVHFGIDDLEDNLVTSYFDKLIQVPLEVPRLSISEVKAYLILLLADLEQRRGVISKEVLAAAQVKILEAARNSWKGCLTRKTMEDAFGTDATKLGSQIDLADQLAGLMATADNIAGNPRLIKRFLNNLIIRDTVARSQGMTVAFEELVKLQLFERCTSSLAFEYLVKKVAESSDGKLSFLKTIEDALAKGEVYNPPDPCWNVPFIAEWLKLTPRLAAIDLRPLLYLSRDKAMNLASFDELSVKGRELLTALAEIRDVIQQPMITKLQALGEAECGGVLSRLLRLSRTDQWSLPSLIRCLHVTRAFAGLGPVFASHLETIPATNRPAPLIPHIKGEAWAQDMLQRWSQDTNTPVQVRNAISMQGRK